MNSSVMLDGSVERIRCITEHEDYTALTNKTVFVARWPAAKMQKWKFLPAFRQSVEE